MSALKERPPYGSYAALVGTFSGLLATVGASVGSSGVTLTLGRLLTWSLGAAAANDFLRAGFAALTAKASALEEETT